MIGVDDVARYMLTRRSMTAMKLQKLIYYAQAWHLARTGEPLFREPIEAWANGPVVRDLYDRHRGQFSLNTWPVGDPDVLSDAERSTIELVLDTYGAKDAQWLSEQTHAEAPWRAARGGIPDGVRSSTIIDRDIMLRFYMSEEAAGRPPDVVVKRP
jgi:uncharacterized phage-associated protein